MWPSGKVKVCNPAASGGAPGAVAGAVAGTDAGDAAVVGPVGDAAADVTEGVVPPVGAVPEFCAVQPVAARSAARAAAVRVLRSPGAGDFKVSPKVRPLSRACFFLLLGSASNINPSRWG
jgi:hypothetical protein